METLNHQESNPNATEWDDMDTPPKGSYKVFDEVGSGFKVASLPSRTRGEAEERYLGPDWSDNDGNQLDQARVTKLDDGLYYVIAKI